MAVRHYTYTRVNCWGNLFDYFESKMCSERITAINQVIRLDLGSKDSFIPRSLEVASYLRMSQRGEKGPDADDIRRFIPQVKNKDGAHLGHLGEGDR